MQLQVQGDSKTTDTLDFVEVSVPEAGDIIAVIPAYNEERFIGSVVLATAPYVDKVMIVDDGSTDNTAMIAHAAGAEVISMETNSGKGAALKRGITHALQNYPVKLIILIDGDGQHQSKEMPEVMRPVLEGAADIVVGSRFLGIESYIPWWRQIGQHGLTWFTNAASGVPLTDSQSGFRALSRRAASHLTRHQGNGFSVESEMQFIVKDQGLRIQEVPISCIYAEPSKRNPLVHGLQVLESIIRLAGQSRPVLFYSGPALVSLIAGILISRGVVESFNNTQQLSLGYALAAVLLVLLGAFGLSTGMLLHAIRSLLLHIFRDHERW